MYHIYASLILLLYITPHRPFPSLHVVCNSHTPTTPWSLVEMRTRGGCGYGSQVMDCRKRRRKDARCCDVVTSRGGDGVSWEDGRRKRCRVIGEDSEVGLEVPSTSDSGFESLPDDLVVTILSRVSSSAASPSDFLTIFVT